MRSSGHLWHPQLRKYSTPVTNTVFSPFWLRPNFYRVFKPSYSYSSNSRSEFSRKLWNMYILVISFSECNNKDLCLLSILLYPLISFICCVLLCWWVLHQVSLFLLSTIASHLSLFMCLLRSKKKDNSHVRKFLMISTFVLLNYYHLSVSPHFSKSWHRDLSFCIVSNPGLSHCTDLFQHDLPFWVFSLLMTYLRWPVKALIHPLIILWLFSCFPPCR